MQLENIIKIIESNNGEIFYDTCTCYGDIYDEDRVGCNDCVIFPYKHEYNSCTKNSDKILDTMKKELRKKKLQKLLS